MEKFKVIILLAHPNIQDSQANKALIETIKEYPYVGIINLYDNPYDIEKQIDMISNAKAVIFQFPLYWASAPSELKKWIDEVFTPISKTNIVKDKPLQIITTTASEYEAYRSGGRNKFTLDELLRPYEMLANHSGMKWCTPMAVYGINTPSVAINIERGKKEYRNIIEQLIR